MDRSPLSRPEVSTIVTSLSLSQVVHRLQQGSVVIQAPQAIAQQIMAWTNGQPELTQCLIDKVLRRLEAPFSGTALELVNQEVKDYFSPDLLAVANRDETPTISLLTRLKEVLLQDKRQDYRRLKYYQAVLLKPHNIPPGYQVENNALVEGGLLSKNARGQTKVANPIYRRVFNAPWIEQQLDRPLIQSKGNWLLLTSLLSILAFIVLQSIFRYIPLSANHHCHQETDLRDAVLAKLSLEPMQMQTSINQLLTLRAQNQLSDQCQSVLHDLQYSYGIYVSAGTHNNPIDAAQYLCQIPESYYLKRNSVPWFSRWSNIYKRIDFADSLANYVEQNPCPGYSFLNRVSP
ncbi:hypothetical protein [Leptothoe kymatousa]|uniref:Uncharacterized protein n=1 Tax=Leptothoe kymatousa TAU-MAC 1615 TaxID=2364775 RepID=A0ABS5XZB2_9CYAN|nr:hypothetical protein [Leptothoe kymatousa]MBT9310947.1 hypothetical protein [Leptothoe kymatousa TAU-MAC 1615]